MNAVIQSSIQRSRRLRDEIEKKSDKIFNDNHKESIENFKWSDPKLDLPFAKDQSELKERLVQQLISFIAIEKQRYGASIIEQNEKQTLTAYENYLRSFEDQYLYQTENGHPLPQKDEENLFALHVIKALASSIDAHTKFYNSTEAFEMKLRLVKSFNGLGLSIEETKDGKMIINRMIDNSPALKGGLIKINDQIIEINGKSVKGLTLAEVVEKLRELEGQPVNLSLKRTENGTDKLLTVVLKSAEIALNEGRATYTYEKFGNGIIGVITLNSFYQGDNGVTSANDVRNAIKELQSKGLLRGLVLDLRYNSGGFLTQAIKVAGLFITDGVIVISKYFNGEEHFFRDVDSQVYFDGPLVILTSKATASAAEIVAQALQDYGVALVVGDEHTYGKGTIQTQTVTANKNTSYFKVTVGKYYTVSGKTPQGMGVAADIVVPGKLDHEHIGEEYLDYSLKGDQISPAFNDSLTDVPSNEKPWYLKYYMPHLQQQTNMWRKFLPVLKKNSDYRLTKNKDYQLFLTGKINDNESDNEDVMPNIKNAKNFGKNDLQVQEAINIVQDMIMLDIQAKNQEVMH